MGGNITLSSGECAHLIDIRNNRQDIKNIIEIFLFDINNAFDNSIWYDLSGLINSRTIFSGSTAPLFDNNITDVEFKKYKPFLGDIDVKIPKEIANRFKIFLESMKGKMIGQVKYLGNNSMSGQISALIEPPKNLIPNIQIDFEIVDFKDEKPTEFSIFSHSSSWNDIKQNIKGIAHKYLIRSLIAIKKHEDVVLLTKNNRISKKDINMNVMSYSVDKGFRFKFIKSGCLDGKMTVKEIVPSDRIYYQDIGLMFSIIFGYMPSGNDMVLFGSFTGILDLIKQSFCEDDIINVYNKIVDLLFGPKAQKLYKDVSGKTQDYEVKMAVISKFYESFDFIDIVDSSLIDDFYKVYK